MTAFIASVRLKSDGRVFYRVEGLWRSWTENRSEATHFPTRDEAERSIKLSNPDMYDQFVGTAGEVTYWASGGIIAAVRMKENGRIRYRVSPRYPHLGAGTIWSDDIKDAHRFDSMEAAKHVLRLMNDLSFEKKVGTPSQVASWANQEESLDDSLKKLQDQVNAGIKKIAQFYEAPALFVHPDGATASAPKVDPIAEVFETYIEKARKIEEEGSDEFTWRGFLLAFLKDIQEGNK